MGKFRRGTLRHGEKAEAKRAVKRAVGQRGPDKGPRGDRIEAVRLRAKGFATAFEVARAEGTAFTTVRRRIAKGLIPGKQLDALGNLTEGTTTSKHWYVDLARYVAMLDATNPSRAPLVALATQLGIELAPKGKAPVMDLG